MTEAFKGDEFKGDVRLLIPLNGIRFSKKLKAVIHNNNRLKTVADLMALHRNTDEKISPKWIDTRTERQLNTRKHIDTNYILSDEINAFLKLIDPRFKTGSIVTHHYSSGGSQEDQLRKQFAIPHDAIIPDPPLFNDHKPVARTFNGYNTQATSDGVELTCTFRSVPLQNLIKDQFVQLCEKEVSKRTGGILKSHDHTKLVISFNAKAPICALIKNGYVILDTQAQQEALDRYTQEMENDGQAAVKLKHATKYGINS